MNFDDLYNKYAGRIRRLAFSYLHDEFRAEDVCQEVLLKAHSHLPESDWQDAWRWLSKVTKNLCIDILRAVREQTTQERDVASDEPDPEELYARAVKKELVEVALGRIPSKHRGILALRYRKELSHKEIGEVTGASATSVNNQIHYAKRLLKVELRKLGLPALAGWPAVRFRRPRFILANALVATSVVVAIFVMPLPSEVPSANPLPHPVGRVPPLPTKGEVISDPVEHVSTAPSIRHMSAPQATGSLTPSLEMDSPVPRDREDEKRIQVGPVGIECSRPSGPLTGKICELGG
ncbi:MAG: RNA polymerase sigma factor [Actinomycetota bacterium]